MKRRATSARKPTPTSQTATNSQWMKSKAARLPATMARPVPTRSSVDA